MKFFAGKRGCTCYMTMPEQKVVRDPACKATIHQKGRTYDPNRPRTLKRPQAVRPE